MPGCSGCPGGGIASLGRGRGVSGARRAGAGLGARGAGRGGDSPGVEPWRRRGGVSNPAVPWRDRIARRREVVHPRVAGVRLRRRPGGRRRHGAWRRRRGGARRRRRGGAWRGERRRGCHNGGPGWRSAWRRPARLCGRRGGGLRRPLPCRGGRRGGGGGRRRGGRRRAERLESDAVDPRHRNRRGRGRRRRRGRGVGWWWWWRRRSPAVRLARRRRRRRGLIGRRRRRRRLALAVRVGLRVVVFQAHRRCARHGRGGVRRVLVGRLFRARFLRRALQGYAEVALALLADPHRHLPPPHRQCRQRRQR